jgi:ATP-binding cassette, subfamily B, bacterial
MIGGKKLGYTLRDEIIKEIPDYVDEILRQHGISKDDIMLTAKCDLNIEGNFGECYVLATKEQLLVDSVIYATCDISKLSSERVVGGGLLIGEIDGEEKILCRHSSSCARDFGLFVKLFNKVKEGKELTKEDFKEENISANCPKCGTRYEDTLRKICRKCFDKRAILMRVLSYLPKYKLYIAAILFCMLLSSLLNVIFPYFGGNVFYDQVLKEGGTYYGEVAKFVLIMFGIKFSATVVSIFYGRINSTLSARVVYDLKTEIFQSLQRLSLSFYSSKETGTLMNNVNGDAMKLQQFFHDGVPYFIVNVITMLGILIVMLRLKWELALLAIFPVPIIVYVLKRLFPRLWTLFSRVFRKGSALNSVISDSLSGIRVVKAFGKENSEVQRFSRINTEAAKVNVDVENMIQTAFPFIHLFMGFGGLIVWGYGGWLVIKGEMTFGSLITFTGYVGMLMGPLHFMTQITQWWSDCMNSASRIFEIMDAVPEIQERHDAVTLPHMEGNVKLTSVSFGYELNIPVLQDINLEVKAGEMIGIVGHSGAGKSTLTNLITRLYDVKEGNITIDEINIRDLRLNDLHSQIGLVLQETYLFMGTIAENISYARPEATMEEIIAAAKIANAHDFIMKLNDGYETVIGTKGQSLSGGEKQRISIARAVLLNPKILILDEATASLDTETEKAIQEALERLVIGRTTFAIAHRLSTLRNADRLVVIEKGKLEELGTHEELIKKKGIYYKLLQKQREALKLQGVS